MPSKAKETVVEIETAESAGCSCGTHGNMKIIVHVVVGFIALFMLASAFGVGAFIGRFAGNHDGRNGMFGANGTCPIGTSAYRQDIRGCNEIGNRGPGMMNNNYGSGRGMMRGGQGYYYDQEDSSAPDTQ